MSHVVRVKYRGGSPKAAQRKINLVDRMKAVRQAEGLSQKRFGERLGIPWRTYQNYETGSRIVTVDVLVRLIAEFDLDSELVLFGDEGRPKDQPDGS